MRRSLTLMVAVLLLSPLAVCAQEAQVSLDAVAQAMGANTVKSIQITGTGANFQVGQSPGPELPWPRFNVKQYVRSVNYDTAALRDEIVRTQAENPPRGGGGQPVRGEQRQNIAVSGEHAWNVVNDAPVPAPITLRDRQFQVWATPHGIVKAALANRATVRGRTFAFTLPGRYAAKATVNDQNLVEKVDAWIPNPVVGEMRVIITYSGYKDWGGVKFPTRIRQTAGEFPSLDLTVTEVRANAPVDISVPDPVRQASGIYSRVANQRVADGVWYVTGGTHHSVVIEMKDHIIVVEGPQNDERALAVIAETKRLVTGKPIRYVVASHHHFDHAGGLRAFAAEGVTIVTHDVNVAFIRRMLVSPALLAPDHLERSGKKGTVEGVAGRRVLTDGVRVVELHHIPGNGHADGLLMVYLPKEKVLIEADVFTPLAPNVAVPTPPNPATVQFADTLARASLAVDQLLPLHGRIVPLSELYRTIGRTP